MFKKLRDFFKKLAAKKSFWIVLGAFILALASILLIYLFEPKFVPEPIRTGIKKTIDEVILGDKTANQGTNNNSGTRNSNGGQSGTGSNTDTSSWPTYTNAEFGFSVKYPEGWIVNEIKNTMISLYSSNNQNVNTRGDIVIQIKQNLNNLGLKNFYNGQNDVDYFSDAAGGYEEFMINGKQAIKFKNVQGLINTSIIIIINGNQFIEIEDAGEKHLEDGVLNSIANSFETK